MVKRLIVEITSTPWEGHHDQPSRLQDWCERKHSCLHPRVERKTVGSNAIPPFALASHSFGEALLSLPRCALVSRFGAIARLVIEPFEMHLRYAHR